MLSSVGCSALTKASCSLVGLGTTNEAGSLSPGKRDIEEVGSIMLRREGEESKRILDDSGGSKWPEKRSCTSI